VLSVDEIVSITLDQMRAEFRSSRAGNYLKNPKTCGLLEHEYGVEVTDDRWKEVASNVETCLRNFYASDIYDGHHLHAPVWELKQVLNFDITKSTTHRTINVVFIT